MEETATTSMPTAEELRIQGNDHFVKNEFAEAESIYTKAIDSYEPTVFLLTNRAAARFNMGNFEEAINDAQKSIDLDESWVKAYFRKAAALEKLGNLRDAYYCWKMATKKCAKTAWLTQQIDIIKKKWIAQMKTAPVISDEDLVDRMALFADRREKLSTMAHLWNESSPVERLNHVNLLISLIKGAGGLSNENQEISEEMMKEMPLHNYEDMPRDNIIVLCKYFNELPSERKTLVFESIWRSLTVEDQSAVITDLRMFISNEMQASLSPAHHEDVADDSSVSAAATVTELADDEN